MDSATELWAFPTDAATERTLRQALAGREAAKILRGKLSDAVGVLAKAPSPKLVIVDLDGAAEPEAAFGQLRTVCSFGTEFVGLGSIDSTSFARVLLHDGFTDYLAKPVSVADVREACAAVLDDVPSRDYAGRVIGFVGSGGSGVTSLVAATAREIRARDLNCIILSFDPVLSESFGIEPSGDLSELLLKLEAGEVPEFEPFDRPEDVDAEGVAVVAYSRLDALPVVPSSSTGQTLIRLLANRAARVLLAGVPDPAMLSELMKLTDARVVLYEPTLVSINVAVRCLALLGPEHPALLVQSHPRVRRSSLSSAQIRYALGDREPDIVLPHEAALNRQLASASAWPSTSRRYRKTLKQAVERVLERSQ